MPDFARSGMPAVHKSLRSDSRALSQQLSNCQVMKAKKFTQGRAQKTIFLDGKSGRSGTQAAVCGCFPARLRINKQRVARRFIKANRVKNACTLHLAVTVTKHLLVETYAESCNDDK